MKATERMFYSINPSVRILSCLHLESFLFKVFVVAKKLLHRMQNVWTNKARKSIDGRNVHRKTKIEREYTNGSVKQRLSSTWYYVDTRMDEKLLRRTDRETRGNILEMGLARWISCLEILFLMAGLFLAGWKPIFVYVFSMQYIWWINALTNDEWDSTRWSLVLEATDLTTESQCKEMHLTSW